MSSCICVYECQRVCLVCVTACMCLCVYVNSYMYISVYVRIFVFVTMCVRICLCMLQFPKFASKPPGMACVWWPVSLCAVGGEGDYRHKVD